jgi:hypothetical protein
MEGSPGGDPLAAVTWSGPLGSSSMGFLCGDTLWKYSAGCLLGGSLEWFPWSRSSVGGPMYGAPGVCHLKGVPWRGSCVWDPLEGVSRRRSLGGGPGGGPLEGTTWRRLPGGGRLMVVPYLDFLGMFTWGVPWGFPFKVFPRLASLRVRLGIPWGVPWRCFPVGCSMGLVPWECPLGFSRGPLAVFP